MNTETEHLEKDNGDAHVAPVEHTRSGRFYRPTVDILEREDELLVLSDLPGVGAGDVDIRFEDGVLTMVGRAAPRQKAEIKFLLCEYGIGDFERSFQVSDQVDAEQITAEISAGVLTLHLPKSAAARPRRIAVQAR